MSQFPSTSQSSNNFTHEIQIPTTNTNFHSNKQYAFNTNRINKMPDEQLVGTLKYHGLNSKGSPEILRKRLKEFMKSQMSGEHADPSQSDGAKIYTYFLIIDFEATCDEINGANYQHEIIEFPIILYDVVLKRKIDVFHAYCRPFINPSLSPFCVSLTHIDQSTIDSAKSFPEVLTEVEQWLNKHHMFARSFAVVCDCNADMAKFMRLQCEISGLEFPAWCRHWINVMKTFRQFYGVGADVKLNMQKMLGSLGLEFKGRQHSGLNDAENILRITETMINDGCVLRVNEKLDPSPPHFTASVTRSEAAISGGGGGGGASQYLPHPRIDFAHITAASAQPFPTVSDSMATMPLEYCQIDIGELRIDEDGANCQRFAGDGNGFNEFGPINYYNENYL